MGRLPWFQCEPRKVSNSVSVLLHVTCFKLPSANMSNIFFVFSAVVSLSRPQLELWIKFHVISEINFLLYSGPLDTLEQGYITWQLLFREDPVVSRGKAQGRIPGVACTTLTERTPCRLLRDTGVEAAASVGPLIETLRFHKLPIEWWNTFKSLQQQINTGPSLVFQFM